FVISLVRDITERKRRERELRRSERRFRNLAENLDQVFWITDPEFEEFEYLSPLTEEWFHKPVEEFYEDPFTWESEIHPDDLPTVKREINKHIINAETPGEYETFQCEFRVKDGDSYRWCRAEGTPYLDDSGNVTKVLGFIQDITEQKQSQRRIRTFFESPMSFRAILEPDGTLLEINRPSLEVLDCEEGELIGTPFWETPVWDPDPEVQKDIRQALETPFFIANEEKRYGEEVFNPVTDEDGNVRYIFTEGRDITERHEAREKLKESEKRFRQLVRTAPNAVISTNDRGEITLWNETAEEIFGYPEDEILGEPVTKIMPEDYREDHRASFKKYLQTGEESILGETVELKGLHRNGETFPIELSLSDLGESPGEKSYRFTAIIRDITQRKEAEKSLQESERRFRQMAENIDEIIYMFSGDWSELLYVNSQYEEIWGRSREQLHEDP
ncbi:MAG: PAS domain S-box protein, partial [bacterium]